jgi:hypothetical protein
MAILKDTKQKITITKKHIAENKLLQKRKGTLFA